MHPDPRGSRAWRSRPRPGARRLHARPASPSVSRRCRRRTTWSTRRLVPAHRHGARRAAALAGRGRRRRRRHARQRPGRPGSAIRRGAGTVAPLPDAGAGGGAGRAHRARGLRPRHLARPALRHAVDGARHASAGGRRGACRRAHRFARREGGALDPGVVRARRPAWPDRDTRPAPRPVGTVRAALREQARIAGARDVHRHRPARGGARPDGAVAAGHEVPRLDPRHAGARPRARARHRPVLRRVPVARGSGSRSAPATRRCSSIVPVATRAPSAACAAPRATGRASASW